MVFMGIPARMIPNGIESGKNPIWRMKERLLSAQPSRQVDVGCWTMRLLKVVWIGAD
jgi:hypothetical protein